LVAQYLDLVLLVCAVAFCAMRAFQQPGEIDFGWLGVSCAVAAVWLIPAITDIRHVP
jgi:hypothetical protein